MIHTRHIRNAIHYITSTSHHRKERREVGKKGERERGGWYGGWEGESEEGSREGGRREGGREGDREEGGSEGERGWMSNKKEG